MASVSGALGLTNDGGLQKLTIYGFDHKNRDEKSTLSSNSKATHFEAFINPDEFTINYSPNYDQTVPIGEETIAGTFLGSTPMELQLKFFIDGSLNREKDDPYVTNKIKEFYDACGYVPDTHRPKYIRIIWGGLTLMRFDPDIFDGCLKNASIQYKLFNDKGLPLRALITANFIETVTVTKEEALKTTSSPDLTHIRIVKEGDTLPAMAGDVYGDFKHYLEVARVNGLQNFRDLTPGQKLFFPPFDKNVRTQNNA